MDRKSEDAEAPAPLSRARPPSAPAQFPGV